MRARGREERKKADFRKGGLPKFSICDDSTSEGGHFARSELLFLSSG